MNCKQSRARLIELARTGASGAPGDAALARHLEACAACSGFLDSQFRLNSALASLVAEAEPEPAPENLEAKVLAEFDGARSSPPRVSWWFPARAAILAASLAGTALLIYRPAPAPRATQAGVEPFVRIPYVAPLAPYERTQVMRIEVQIAALIAAGFEVHGADAAAAVTADILVGQDGRAHAIRLVSSSVSNPNFGRRFHQ